MLQPCQDNYSTTFSSLPSMIDYHAKQAKNSRWERTDVNKLSVAPLDKNSPLYGDSSKFASGISEGAIRDTAEKLGLAMKHDGAYYPIRSTAYKGLLDRAKISGTSLPKLRRTELAGILNSCLRLYPKSQALLLIRDEKIAAAHSGDECDYSILEMDRLMEALKKHLDKEFPGSAFENGYSDHTMTCASWTLPGQREALLGTYEKALIAQGKGAMVSKLMPGVRFTSSDTGVASAKVSALLLGGQDPIHIGGTLALEHRNTKKVEDFEASLAQLFAKFGESIAKLEKLLNIQLSYPVNAMTRVCKYLRMPKKAAIEAIAMFEVASGNAPATAHDVFMAMQEIIFNLKSEGTPEGKIIVLAENMARAVTLRWSDYDLAKAVEY